MPRPCLAHFRVLGAEGNPSIELVRGANKPQPLWFRKLPNPLPQGHFLEPTNHSLRPYLSLLALPFGLSVQAHPRGLPGPVSPFLPSCPQGLERRETAFVRCSALFSKGDQGPWSLMTGLSLTSTFPTLMNGLLGHSACALGPPVQGGEGGGAGYCSDLPTDSHMNAG